MLFLPHLNDSFPRFTDHTIQPRQNLQQLCLQTINTCIKIFNFSHVLTFEPAKHSCQIPHSCVHQHERSHNNLPPLLHHIILLSPTSHWEQEASEPHRPGYVPAFLPQALGLVTYRGMQLFPVCLCPCVCSCSCQKLFPFRL